MTKSIPIMPIPQGFVEKHIHRSGQQQVEHCSVNKDQKGMPTSGLLGSLF